MSLAEGSSRTTPPDDQTTVIATSIDIEVQGKKIGAVDSFNVNMSRVVQRVRALNSEWAGETIEIVPGVGEASVTVSGFMLYTKGLHHLFQRIPGDAGKVFTDLVSQKVPITLVERYTHQGTGQTFKVRYIGCWLTQYSKSQNINTAMIAENATLEVQKVLADADS
jgi:hypothetical protein